MGKLIIIRHAQASFGKANYDQLSNLGREQAKVLGQYIAECPLQLNKVYRGDLQRHQETEAIIKQASGGNWSVEILPELNEHQGPKVVGWVVDRVLQGEQATELKGMQALLKPLAGQHPNQQYLAAFEYGTLQWAKGTYNTTPIGTEDWQTFHQRVRNAYAHILAASQTDETIGIVTSCGPIGVAVGEALKLNVAQIMQLTWVLQNTAISEFSFSEHTLTLHSFNSVAHLKEDRLITLV
ncbi:MAG: histidine phosphatase family protein [Bacteroidota bacterium]